MSQTLSSPALDDLRVVWVEQDNLFAWTQESASKQLASGSVVRAYIAPDGERIAFTRGTDGRAESLWVVNFDASDPQELVSSSTLQSAADNVSVIADVAWLDASTLYFNTIQTGSLGLQYQNDLWRVNIDTGQSNRLLAPGDGGAFTFSPDARHIAIIFPGTYGETDGRIHLSDIATTEAQNSFSFTGVSTGAEYPFYPEVFWEPDSNALLVAIPDQDLIYADGGGSSVALWRLGIDGSQEQIGSVNASFFGLPRWSGDATKMLFLRRVGDRGGNEFNLMIADANGENAVEYASDEAGSIGLPAWIPGSTQFMYPQGEPGTYWLGSPDAPSHRLSEQIFSPKFVGQTGVVFTTVSESSYELRYLQWDASTSILLGKVAEPLPIFDVIRVKG
jgi:Tol biopolymer transport system component